MIQQSKWMSLYELVTDHKKPIDHGGLATAIEKHALQYIDEHGRRKLATNGPEEDACSINFALRLLFTYKVAPEDHPIFYEQSLLFKFGWPEDIRPDLSSINPHYVVSSVGSKDTPIAPGSSIDGCDLKGASYGFNDNDDWKMKARKIADRIFDHDTSLNTRRTLKAYAEKVMLEMQRLNIHGPRGRIDNAGTVLRDALQSKKWWEGKKK